MRFLDLAALPATLAHELAHVLASAPWARRAAIVIETDGGRPAAAHIEWHEDAAWYGPFVASLAPLVLATVAALLAGWLWIANGFATPSSVADLALWAIIGAWWSVFAFPSGGDLAVAHAALRGGESDA